MQVKMFRQMNNAYLSIVKSAITELNAQLATDYINAHMKYIVRHCDSDCEIYFVVQQGLEEIEFEIFNSSITHIDDNIDLHNMTITDWTLFISNRLRKITLILNSALSQIVK